MRAIYLIVGYTGQYDDAKQWTVCGFTDLKMAQEREKLCNKTSKEFWGLGEGKGKYEQVEYANSLVVTNKPDCDPEMKFDLGGTYYQCEGPVLVNSDDDASERLRKKVKTYESFLHAINTAAICMNNEMLGKLLENATNWSYAHRQGNGALTQEEQDELVQTAFDRLLITSSEDNNE